MNKRACAVPLAMAMAVSAAAFPITGYFQRYRGPAVRVRNIEGVRERVSDGKLHLRLKDFLELVLANNTEINITRLDVMNAASSVIAAHAPYDPNITAGFTSVRTVSPSFTQIAG